MKRPKAFRGQRKQQKFVGCGCYLCTGHDKRELLTIKEKEIEKQVKIELLYEDYKTNGQSL